MIQTFTGTDVTSQLSYDPFGNLTSGEPAGSSYFGFNAEDTSGLTGLQYLRARYYDISDGRFITADDYLGDTEEPLTLNRYAYTANNPMKYVDPSGHFSLTKFTLNRFSNIDKRANILRTANNAFGKAIKTVTAISSLFMPQSTRKAYTTVVNNAVNKMTASVNRNINNGNYSNYNTTGKYSKYNNYSYNNNRYSKTGNTSTGVKQKTNTTIQNTYKPIIETFVNMMGIGVQLAVGSSQVKRHLDYVKKKIVNYYCGISEKIMSTVKENKRIEIDSWKKSYGFIGYAKIC